MSVLAIMEKSNSNKTSSHLIEPSSKRARDSDDQHRAICRYYLQGHCSKGNDCPFLHELPSQTLCKFFLNGFCRNGDRCSYSHDLKQEGLDVAHARVPPSRNRRTSSKSRPMSAETHPSLSYPAEPIVPSIKSSVLAQSPPLWNNTLWGSSPTKPSSLKDGGIWQNTPPGPSTRIRSPSIPGMSSEWSLDSVSASAPLPAGSAGTTSFLSTSFASLSHSDSGFNLPDEILTDDPIDVVSFDHYSLNTETASPNSSLDEPEPDAAISEADFNSILHDLNDDLTLDTESSPSEIADMDDLIPVLTEDDEFSALPSHHRPVGPSPREKSITSSWDGGLSKSPSMASGFAGRRGDIESRVICTFHVEGNCRYGDTCRNVHGEYCSICQKPALIPGDEEQNEEHMFECVDRQRQRQELDESRPYSCESCGEAVVDLGRRFGLLTDCTHCFCLPCIKEFRNETQSSECPVCGLTSYYVVPSNVMIIDAEKKAAVIATYKEKMKQIPCKYFDGGRGSCKFGANCHYAHRGDPGVAPRTDRQLTDAHGNPVNDSSLNLGMFITHTKRRKKK